MTSTMRKGLVVAALHVAIVASLGAKLLVDRATRPRVWVRTAPVDPSLPIRGRYVRLRVMADPGSGADNASALDMPWVTLSAQEGRLVATPSRTRSGLFARVDQFDGQRVIVLGEPIAYFIPEHVPDPSRRPAGEELWVEVTIPRAGAPRPIRLGVKKDGALTPLDD